MLVRQENRKPSCNFVPFVFNAFEITPALQYIYGSNARTDFANE